MDYIEKIRLINAVKECCHEINRLLDSVDARLDEKKEE